MVAIVTTSSIGPLSIDASITRGSVRVEAAFVAEPGCTTALVGPNGAGKSTVVDLIAGLVAAERGRIALGEVVFDDATSGVFIPPHVRRVGIMFQQPRLVGHLSALNNVAFAVRLQGASKSNAASIAAQWLQRVGVGEVADEFPAALSGGQAQRVALARVLATEPRLLVFDEPLSAVDIGGRASLRRLLAEHLAQFAGPRLIISHDPTDVFALADHVVVLEHGSVRQQGTADALRRAPASAYVAELTGINLLRGAANRGRVAIDDTTHTLVVADTEAAGPVHLRVAPNALSLHRIEPSGSPRNTWRATVVGVEELGSVRRVHLDRPVPMIADVTAAAASDLDLAPGVEVWVSAKATEMTLAPR